MWSVKARRKDTKKSHFSVFVCCCCCFVVWETTLVLRWNFTGTLRDKRSFFKIQTIFKWNPALLLCCSVVLHVLQCVHVKGMMMFIIPNQITIDHIPLKSMTQEWFLKAIKSPLMCIFKYYTACITLYISIQPWEQPSQLIKQLEIYYRLHYNR